MVPMRLPYSLKALREMCDYIVEHIDPRECDLIEIGSYTGDSTEIFCEYFKRVIAIDPWLGNVGGITNEVDMSEVYDIFCEKMRDTKNLTVLKHFSNDVVHNFEDGSISVVYIDGDHEYDSVLEDIQNWLPKVKHFICGHDYSKTRFPGVVKAVHETIGEPDKTFPDMSWIKKV